MRYSWSAEWWRMTGTGPSAVTIALPTPNARGWRSAWQLFSNTARACEPLSSRIVRLAERSTACPGSPSRAASASRDAPGCCRRETSTARNSSGDSHRTCSPALSPVTSPTRRGSGSPSTASRARPEADSGSARRPSWTAKDSSRRPTASPPASLASDMSGARCAAGETRRSSSCAVGAEVVVSAIAAVPFRIVEDGRGDLDVDEGVSQRGLDDLAHPVPPVLDHGEPEGPLQAGREVGRGDVTDHRHRSGLGRDRGARRDELRALRQPGAAVDGQHPHEVLAVLAGRVDAGVGALADEVLELRDDPLHARVLRRHRPVGVLPDDDEALLRAQHVHGLRAVRGDAVLGAGVRDRLPHGEAVERVDVDLEGQLTGEGDPADPRGHA